MRCHVVTQGEHHAALLASLIETFFGRAQVEVVYAGGRSSAVSLARTILATRDTVVALVIDAETCDTTRAEESGSRLTEVLEGAAPPERFRIFVVVPELAACVFEDVESLKRVFPGVISSEIVAQGRREPAAVLEQLLRGRDREYHAGSVRGLMDELEPEVLRQSPILQPLLDFLSGVVLGQAPRCNEVPYKVMSEAVVQRRVEPRRRVPVAEPIPSGDDEARWGERLREDDDSVLAEVLELWGDAVAGWLQRRYGGTLTRQDIEEILNDALLALWVHRRSYDPRRASLRTYFGQIVLRKAYDRIALVRRQGNQDKGGPVGHGQVAQDDKTILRSIWPTLSEADQGILMMWAAHYPYEDIADALHITVGTARQRCKRARDRIVAEFVKHGYAPTIPDEEDSNASDRR